MFRQMTYTLTYLYSWEKLTQLKMYNFENSLTQNLTDARLCPSEALDSFGY